MTFVLTVAGTEAGVYTNVDLEIDSVKLYNAIEQSIKNEMLDGEVVTYVSWPLIAEDSFNQPIKFKYLHPDNNGVEKTEYAFITAKDAVDF